MSWPLAAFALLLAALGGGAWWYERTQPNARAIALVATLAALAALGRIAFAPLPDIKPTTDIVLLAGFALGAAPGWAVGVVAALASNMFFGQGPWTPWQMLAWGLIGVGGAALGRLSGHRAHRFGLALACALAGVLFALILNFSTWVTFTGIRTPGSFLAVMGSALPFDLAHVVGNVIFCLAFGPAFARSLLRFRRRLHIRWEPVSAGVLLLGCGALLAAGLGPGARTASAQTAQAAQQARIAAQGREVGYLLRAQNSDGGFGAAPGQHSSQLFSAWASLGLAAAGRRPGMVRRANHSPVSFMLAHLGELSGTGDAERTVLALAAGGARIPTALLRRIRQAPDGSFGEQVNLTAFGILALRSAHRRSGLARAGAWLQAQQNTDGGFNFATRGGGSGIDDTAAAIEGLIAAGIPAGGPQAVRAEQFLAAHQNSDGGFPLTPGGDSNAQSSAFAIQSLLAGGRDPSQTHAHGSPDPLSYLAGLTRDDGAVQYSRTSAQTPVWVTAQALAAITRRPLPIAPPHRARAADVLLALADTL